MSAALGSPFDVTGAAHLPGDGLTLIRVEGFEGSVTYRTGRLAAMLGEGAEVTIGAAAAEAWLRVRDARPAADGAGDVWRISVKPSDGAAVAAALAGSACLLDWGGGLVWARVAEGRDVRAAISGIAGHATLVRGSETVKARLGVFQPEPGPLKRISVGLRSEFDPRGILNPGRMG